MRKAAAVFFGMLLLGCEPHDPCHDTEPALKGFCYASSSLAPDQFVDATSYHFFGDERAEKWAPIQNTILVSQTLLVTGDSPDLILRGLVAAGDALGRSDRQDTLVVVFSEAEYEEPVLDALVRIGVTGKFVSI